MADATPVNAPEVPEQPAPQKQGKVKAQAAQEAPKGVQLETHDAVRVDH